MALLWAYIAVFVAAVIWVTLDKYATGAFEFLHKTKHECARAMGMYWEWVRYSLGRLAVLSLLVTTSLVSTWFVFLNNPLDLGKPSKWMLMAVMLTGTFLVIALPPLVDRLRFIKLTYVKVRQFSGLGLADLSAFGDKTPLEPADYAAENSWSAWHPILENYEQDPIWSDIVPVIYLRRGKQPSMVVPIDFEYFLAWNWPGDVRAEEFLPFTGPGDTRFLMKSKRKLLGRSGWTIIHAEMEDFEGVPIAA